MTTERFTVSLLIAHALLVRTYAAAVGFALKHRAHGRDFAGTCANPFMC